MYFTLPELSTTKIVTWNFHVDDSVEGRYDMILDRDILKALGLNFNFSDHGIKADDGTFKRYKSPMVDLGTYELEVLNTGNITPDESFMNYYAEEIHESEHICTSIK